MNEWKVKGEERGDSNTTDVNWPSLVFARVNLNLDRYFPC